MIKPYVGKMKRIDKDNNIIVEITKNLQDDEGVAVYIQIESASSNNVADEEDIRAEEINKIYTDKAYHKRIMAY